MLKCQNLFSTILLGGVLFFTACDTQNKNEVKEKKVLLQGTADETSYNTAQKFFKFGEYDKALEFHLKQLDEDLKYYEENSLEIALDYNNIGLDYDELKNYPKALEFYLKTMKIDELTLEKNSTERSTTYYNVAASYDELQKYQEAIYFYLKALEIDEKVLGSEHENVWSEYEKLAFAYEQESNLTASLNYWQKSLTYMEHHFGKYALESNETRAKIKEIEQSLLETRN